MQYIQNTAIIVFLCLNHSIIIYNYYLMEQM